MIQNAETIYRTCPWESCSGGVVPRWLAVAAGDIVFDDGAWFAEEFRVARTAKDLTLVAMTMTAALRSK